MVAYNGLVGCVFVLRPNTTFVFFCRPTVPNLACLCQQQGIIHPKSLLCRLFPGHEPALDGAQLLDHT
jgi:hypothetical protein